ncbi:MAG: hypothetical protein J3K34DRAFT_427668 [Monoraphidium minutum]|nr:MAG: hypothetical protein J3K34DRAFT_427668 [Monoraphidium minutum]
MRFMPFPIIATNRQALLAPRRHTPRHPRPGRFRGTPSATGHLAMQSLGLHGCRAAPWRGRRPSSVAQTRAAPARGAAARAAPALPPPRPTRRPRLSVRMDAAAAAGQQQQHDRAEVRMCTGKVCKKQGSEQLVRFGQDLGLRELEITACGCLGNCGNGPNLVVLPQAMVLRHVSTPADLAHVLRAFCGADVGDEVLRATELRLAGNALAGAGDFAGAIERYEAALAAAPRAGSAYMIHSNLSAAHLQLGRKDAALTHAQAAVGGAPRGFHKAHVRLIDSYYALGRFSDADAALSAALAADASFAQQPEYKMIVQALKSAKRSVRV